MKLQGIVFLMAGLLVLPACGSPQPGSGTRVAAGVGVRDFYTVRAADDGSVVMRDLPPEPRPREAITGDDYFQIKLEHIYFGNELGRDVGNIAIISQVEGITPSQLDCVELDVADLEFDLNQRERSNIASYECAYKHAVLINPVFADSHVTFDSTFITPPFRMGMEPIGLRFIVAQLNDYELARQILDWSQQALNNLGDLGLEELTSWQSEVVNIGFTVANYILDYASMPDYVFEFETDFVPIEVLGGVTTPQNIFMGGDFIIVGFPRPNLADLMDMDEDELASSLDRSGAVVMAQQLFFNSGRLYWRSNNAEYREGAYIIFKVVRQSRYPAELPITLARVSREVERGEDPRVVTDLARNTVLNLQDHRVVNETEGRYLLDVFDWFSDARGLERDLRMVAEDSWRPEPTTWPLQMREVPLSIGADLVLLDILSRVRGTLGRLDERIYENYGRNPGMWQAECISIRSVTQGLADGYRDLHPLAVRSFEDLQLRRLSLQRADRDRDEDDELRMLEDAEIWAQRLIDELPERLEEPRCPALRQ